LDTSKTKKYIRVTDGEEDVTIEGLQLAAEEYLTNAGINKNYGKELYSLAIKLLVSHWYENRTPQSEKAQTKLSFSLEAIILQLQFSNDDITAPTENEEDAS
jgi:uncharacterized phage protein (predicted DNA packaging)